MKIFLGHSFSEDLPEHYYEILKKIYQFLYLKDYDIYVGGLLVKLKDILPKYADKITCYSTEKYKEERNYCLNCTYILEDNPISRSEKLITNTDRQIFLPGGTGTLMEILEALEYNRSLGNQIPILIYDEDNECKTFSSYLQELITKKYNKEETNNYICIIHSIEELENKLKEGI